MTANERKITIKAYRLARLLQENLEDRKASLCRSDWAKDDEVLLTEATAQEQALCQDAEAIAKRITGKWGNYTLKDLVEWWFLRDCPWDYVIPDDEWEAVEQAMLDAIAEVEY